MARKRFTQPRVDKFSSDGKGQKFLWDSQTPSLGLRVTKNGVKSFIYQGRLAGSTIRLTIGRIEAWSIDDARFKARELQRLVDQDIDPRQEKKTKAKIIQEEQLKDKIQKITIRDAWQTYIEAKRKKWSDNSLSDHIKAMKPGGEPYKHHKSKELSSVKTKPGILTPIGNLRLQEVTPEKVINWLKKESQTRPTQAALAFRLLRGFVNWCNEDDRYKNIIPNESINSKKVREHVPKPKAKKDVLEKEQLVFWFREVRKLSPVISAYLQTTLLTGARREEILSIRWSDIDFQWDKITLKDKVQENRTIPLTPYIKKMLLQLPRENQWVFSSSKSKNGRLMEPIKAHNKAVKDANISHLTIHGLRRSFTTLENWVSMPPGITHQISGHMPSGTVGKHYDIKPIDILRHWHTEYEKWMLDQAGIETTGSYSQEQIHVLPGPEEKAKKKEDKKPKFKVIE